MSAIDNLIAFHEFEEASGGRADAHGTYDYVDNNAVGQAAGKVGNAADLVASSSQCFTSSLVPALGSQGSAHFMWIYPTALSSENRLSEYGNDGTQYSSRTFRIASGNLRFEINGAGHTSSLAVTLNAWNFVGYSVDGPRLSDVTLYLGDDAGNLQSQKCSGSQTLNTAAPSGKELTINARAGGSNANAGATMRIDQDAVYSASVPLADVEELYNSGAGVSYADIAGGGGGEVEVSGADAGVVASEPLLTPRYSVSPDGALVGVSAAEADAVPRYVVTPEGALVSVGASQPDLSFEEAGEARPESASVAVEASSPALTPRYAIFPESSRSTVSAPQASIGERVRRYMRRIRLGIGIGY